MLLRCSHGAAWAGASWGSSEGAGTARPPDVTEPNLTCWRPEGSWRDLQPPPSAPGAWARGRVGFWLEVGALHTALWAPWGSLAQRVRVRVRVLPGGGGVVEGAGSSPRTQRPVTPPQLLQLDSPPVAAVLRFGEDRRGKGWRGGRSGRGPGAPPLRCLPPPALFFILHYFLWRAGRWDVNSRPSQGATSGERALRDAGGRGAGMRPGSTWERAPCNHVSG